MTDEVSISRPAEAAFNDITGRLSAVMDVVVYSGKARVYPAAGPLLMGLGDESQEFQNTYVSIPMMVLVDELDVNSLPVVNSYSPDPRPDDVVTITAHDDPLMVGRTFRVRDVEAGGILPVVRRMACTGVEDSQHWVDATPTPIPSVWP